MGTGKEATLLIAASKADSNLYYATEFLAPDPFIFLKIRGRKILMMNELELDRARKEAAVDEVISTSKIAAKLKAKCAKAVSSIDLIQFLLKERHVNRLLVP